MEKKAHVDYDEENDILYVYSGEKVKDSLPIDRFIIDFGSDDKPSGLELLDASDFIKNTCNVKIAKSDLNNIKSATLRYWKGNELIFVIVSLLVKIDEKEEDIKLQAPAPMLAASKQ